MFYCIIFFVFINAKTFGAQNDVKLKDSSKQLLTFSPIVTELAQKIVEECLDEYKKMVKTRPYINSISSPKVNNPAIGNGQEMFKYLWVAFHAILRKVLMRNNVKNYKLIANSCQMSDVTNAITFCDFVKSLAFVKRHFETLKAKSNLARNFIGAEEMFENMKAAYKIGWQFAKRDKTFSNIFSNVEKIASDVENGLRQMKFGRHQFEAVDKIWARKMLIALADNCKSYIFDVSESHANRNAFQMSVTTLRNVQLQPPNSSRNQTEIDETCAILYEQYPGKNLCMFAKKLAYLSAFNRNVSIPASAVGCWPLNRNRNKAVKVCAQIMKARYEGELLRMTKYYSNAETKKQFLGEFAFDRQARDVESAIERMFGVRKSK